MKEDFAGVALAETPNNRQRLYVRYFTAILIDLAVLNLFAEHWERVQVNSFTLSLLAAILLQLLLKATLAVEHRVAAYFHDKAGLGWKAGRLLSAWSILFLSKFVMLWVINFSFGDSIHFAGPHHGVLAFIVVIVVMLLAEEVFVRLYRKLA